jgi:DNA (cytosine-5)-methyltransferase 1
VRGTKVYLNPTGYDFLDDFAGPGGFDEGAAALGLRGVGVEKAENPCRTAIAAGHDRIHADVLDVPTERFWGVPGYTGSPPCQPWSDAGLRGGERDRKQCHAIASEVAAGEDLRTAIAHYPTWADPRSPLVAVPVARVRDLEPDWIVLEQVAAVVGLWEHYARIFRVWGYSVWVGTVNAADYGVGQMRKRAVLLGSRTSSEMSPPRPTHAAPDQCADSGLFGHDRQPHRTLAGVLGWEPGQIVNTRGVRPNLAIGGNEFSADEPSWAITGKARSWERRPPREDKGTNETGPAPEWTFERPATTVVGSYRPDVIAPPDFRKTHSRQNAPGSVRLTVAECGIVQSFPADYPWQGSKTSQHQQVGDAVPPLLGAHLIARAADLEPPTALPSSALGRDPGRLTMLEAIA